MFRFDLKLWIKMGVLGFILVLIFLVLTFPYARMGPIVTGLIEKRFFAQALGIPAQCTLEGLSLRFPVGFGWSSLKCRKNNETLIEAANGNIMLWPFSQSFSTEIGKKEMSISTKGRLNNVPNRVSGEIKGIPLENLALLITSIAQTKQPLISSSIQLSGNLFAKWDIPVKDPGTSTGNIDLRIDKLRLPPQSLLGLFGFPEVNFSKASAKATLGGGKITVQEVALLSEEISAKADGEITLQKDWGSANPNILLRWKIKKSDAVMNSPFGRGLAEQPCLSPDQEGFCTNRVLRFGNLFSPGY